MSSAAAAANRRAQVLQGRKRAKVGPGAGISSGGTTPAAGGKPKDEDGNELITNDPKRIREYQTPDDRCPICDTTRYLNSSLRLLVSNKCYHKMCESCIDRIYTLGPEPCPTCSITLRKTDFVPQTFEDLTVEKEVKIRKRIATIFNKRQDDFVDLKSYNDYLEEVEDITFNLLNDIDVPETEAKILAFQRANKDLIDANELRMKDESEKSKKLQEAELEQRRKMMQEFESYDADQERTRQQEEKRLLEQIESATDEKEAAKLLKQAQQLKANREKDQVKFMSGLKSRYDILANQKAKQKQEQEQNANDSAWMDLDHWDDYSTTFKIPTNAWTPSISYFINEDQASQDMINDRKALAGGFKPEMVWERAIRSAIMGLWEQPCLDPTSFQEDVQMST